MISYTIDDDIFEPVSTGVEVTIDFPGEKRWLFFITPELLATAGDYVDGTRVRVHLGERHMIIIGELSESLIDAIINKLYNDGDLYSRTLPVTPL